MHVCPGPQAGPLPQAQLPSAAHESEVVWSQVRHELPLTPHVGNVGASVHELLLQQPPAHEFASH
jgi:hypothetical protein